MGPQPGSPSSGSRQGGSRRRRPGISSSPRRRRCLMKDCEVWFHPRYPNQRYCGKDCREAADRWLAWNRQRRYRRSARGREVRQAQGRRRRERKATESGESEEGVEPATEEVEGGREGHALVVPPGFSSCDRPGCYELFLVTRRSPAQRFCSSNCHRAMWRVVVRERRWQQRRRWEASPGVRPPLRC